MAHFAEVNNEDAVEQVIVVANEVLLDKDGKEVEALGIDFLKSLYGQDTNWVQTSYNGTFRGCYAGVGMIYDKDLNEFIYPEG
jgi:hypothetical protein